LRDYLRSVLKERRLSNNALAKYASIAEGTVRRILAGKKPDPETLQKLAAFLNVPVDMLYRMSGILPDETKRSESIRLIEHLFEKLPESDQAEIIDIIRLKLERNRPGT